MNFRLLWDNGDLKALNGLTQIAVADGISRRHGGVLVKVFN